MATGDTTFSAWLEQAQIPEARLSPDQRGVLLAVFSFRQQQGTDYYSTRILSHFLLHADTGLKVAQIARLLGLSRPTASRQQDLSSKQTVQQAHHRMDGRPYGKLLPRFAGPIAGFLCTHPDASRADLLDFIDDTFGVRVSRIALYKFLKKFGLDQVPQAPSDAAGPPVPTVPATPLSAASAPPFCSERRTTRALS
jgi:transposase